MSGAGALKPRSRRRLVAVTSSIAVCAALLTAPGFAASADGISDESAPQVMRQYPAAEFAAEALALPPELVASIDADLGISGAEYLAQSEAATQAVVVVESLEDAGVDVLGSRIDGTTLTVNVPSESEVTAVEAAGAVAVIGEPVAFVLPDLPLTFTADPVSNFYGGQGYYYESSTSGFRCTSGFNGFSTSGAQQFVSAGHCVKDALNPIRALNMTSPNQTLTTSALGSILGSAVANSAALGGGSDAGLVSISNTSVRPQTSVLTWGGGAGAPLGSNPVTITGKSAAIVGANVCKSGSSTGWACGTVRDVDYSATIGGKIVNSVVTTACTVQGDSGGAMVSGSKAIGVTSWATDVACSDPNFASGAFPMVSAGGQSSVTSLYGSSWQLAVSVAAPVVTTTGVPTPGGAPITGTLADAASGSTVGLYLDGSASPIKTVAVSGSSWSISMADVPVGSHIYRVSAGSGFSRSESVLVGLTVDRLEGANRFATAASVAQQFDSADVVFVASGLDYPDALSAAPVTSRYGAPMLLTAPSALSSETAAEIQRLKPSRIIIVGGVPTISTTVASQLEALLPGTQVERQAGADRYATSRAITRAAFIDEAGSTGASTVFLATGSNFPDALAASAAASTLSAPVILVRGTATSLDAATVSLLRDLGATKVYLLGSSVTVSTGIENYVRGTLNLSVKRLAGDDRYKTAVAINEEVFTSASTAFVAVGTGFADALAGAALAGRDRAPLFISQTECVPAEALSSMNKFGLTSVRLLGSVLVLSEKVAALRSC